MPTRSRVESWRFDHLEQAAALWRSQADRTELAFDRAVQSIGSAPWEGTSADAARDLVFKQLVAVRGAVDQLRQAAGLAGNGASTIADDKRVTLAAIGSAEQQFFAVSEGLEVTDRMPPIFSIPLSVVRHLQASHLQADIQADALQLAADDERVAATLQPLSTALRDFTLGGPSGPGSPGAGAGEPTITGPAGPLTYEQDAADLNVTLPGTDVVISGDGRTGYPTLNGERNPLEVGNPPGGPEIVRPLPTGTIVGPDGKQYALYGDVLYDRKPGTGYAAPDTTVVDLSDPSNRIGMLPGISQASGAYDPKTNRMVIVGNPSAHTSTRMLYTSDPIDPANPNAWIHTVHPVGEIAGLPGNRENQLVALKGGGFMLVGSGDVGPGNQQPVTAVTASTPEGLLTAPSTNLFPPGPQQNWPGGAPPYGPTVVDTTYDPVTGVERVELRVSTWEVPPELAPKSPDDPVKYNPRTYTTNVTVQH